MCTYIRGHAGCLETSTRGRDMRSLAPAFVRALAAPLPPLPSISMTSSSAIDTSLLRERERGISIDFFLKMARWQRPSYARTFGPIVRRMLCDPFEMPFDARIPFPSINMEFRAVETLPPPSVSRRRSGHRPVPRPETTEYFSRSRGRHAHCLHRLYARFVERLVVVIQRRPLAAGEGG